MEPDPLTGEPPLPEQAAACLRVAMRSLETGRTFAAEVMLSKALTHIQTHNQQVIDTKF